MRTTAPTPRPSLRSTDPREHGTAWRPSGQPEAIPGRLRALVGHLPRSRWSDRHARLAAHPLLAACPRREIRTLMRHGDEVEVEADTLLLREDSIGKWFIVVLSGHLVVARHGRPVGMVGPGSWVGHEAILGFGPQPASVTTASSCRLFVLGPRPLLSFALDAPGLREGLFPGMSAAAALDEVRRLRSEGRARWDLLRPSIAQRSADSRSAHAGARSTASLARAARPFLPSAAVLPLLTVPPMSARSRAVARALTVLVVLALAAAAGSFHLPYYSVEGSARSVTDFVSVTAAPSYPPSGELLLLVITARHDTGLAALRGWLDDDVEVRTSQQMYRGQDPAELAAANLGLMRESQQAAQAVVAGALGTRSADVRIDTQDLGGPSGALGLALAIVDVLTPGELTGGQRIAVTGSLAADGTVGPVGGIAHKVRAARRAGVDLLIVPMANQSQAVTAAGHMPVVGVDTFDAALRALAEIGGDPLPVGAS